MNVVLGFFGDCGYLILRDEVYREFVSAPLGALVRAIHGFATQVMVELVEDDEWVDEYIAV